MNKQNITLALSKDLLKRAKIAAARVDTSLSEYMRQALEARLSQSSVLARAKKRQMKLLESGFDLGTKGKIAVSRDELHER